MESSALDFLKRLLATPSPSGFERPIQNVVREYVSSFADRIRHGFGYYKQVEFHCLQH